MRERSDKRKPMTKRTKIAPRLADAASILRSPFREEAERELRALLAVARAAGPGHECGAGARPLACRLCRALSRLCRASREGER